MPKMIINNQIIDNHDCLKLVGLSINDNRSFKKNTQEIIRKGYARVWIIRRLKTQGADRKMLLDAYFRQVRSMVELGVPVWAGQISKKESKIIERVQKISLNVIFGGKLKHYRKILRENRINSLSWRRKKLCINFARKCIKHERFKKWFEKTEESKDNIFKRVQYKKVKGKRNKLKNTPLAYLVKLEQV